MTNRIPFRQMRQTLRLTTAQVALLLGIEGLEWSQQDYALFFVMKEMWHKTDNPTFTQMYTHVVTWLRFYRRLYAQLPEGHELRVTAESEWAKLVIGYEESVK